MTRLRGCGLVFIDVTTCTFSQITFTTFIVDRVGENLGADRRSILDFLHASLLSPYPSALGPKRIVASAFGLKGTRFLHTDTKALARKAPTPPLSRPHIFLVGWVVRDDGTHVPSTFCNRWHSKYLSHISAPHTRSYQISSPSRPHILRRMGR